MGLLNVLRRQAGPNPDPEPGEGGYTAPRGPMGQAGYPGSTSQVRTDPPETEEQLHDFYGGRNTGYGIEADARRGAALVPGSYAPAPNPPPRARRGTGRAWIPFEPQRAELQSDPAEWFGGQKLRVQRGVADNIGINPDRVRDTETPGHANRPVISRGTPYGGEEAEGRNRLFYAGKLAVPDGENRYVFGGPNGGAETYSFDARMPYSGRGNGARGADLNADRYYSPVQPDYFGDQGGQYGYQRESPDGMHRPTEFYEPGPWTENFYDTTAGAGSPGEAGTSGQAISAVYYSPAVTGRRRA
jgi:hypothetical protein